MKNILKYILCLFLVVISACTADPLEDISGDTDWQKDRNILLLLLDGQIGTAVIERNFDDAKLTVYAKTENIADISKVEIKDIQLSYGATTPNAIGTTLDLTNEVDTITVISGAGEALDWEVTMKPFISDMEGTWYIKDIRMYCNMWSDQDWGWEVNKSIPGQLPNAMYELDNVLTFTVDGADESGNPYGKYTHTSGNDATYGDFANEEHDYNERFRTVPTEEGSWTRDFSRNVVVITDIYENEYTLNLDLLGDSADLNLEAPLNYYPELFSWDNTDWDYEELAHMSNPMWYTLTKEKVVQTGNSITTISIEGQVGDATIDAANYAIEIVADYAIINDITQVELKELEISYGATSSVSAGDYIDFSSATSTIEVTSESNETLVWTVTVKKAASEGAGLAGTWTINSIMIHINEFDWESWGKEYNEDLINLLPEAQPEVDNIITFVSEGRNDEGNEYGTYTNATGDDATNGSFTDTDNGWDLNERFRKIPTGEGSWVLDASTNKVTITNTASEAYVLDLVIVADGQINLRAEVPYDSGSFLWDGTDWTYEKLHHISDAIFYDMSIQ